MAKQELLVDFITSLDGYGAGKTGPAGGDSKAPNISPGSISNPNATTRS
jgi:hypothetical protein